MGLSSTYQQTPAGAQQALQTARLNLLAAYSEMCDAHHYYLAANIGSPIIEDLTHTVDAIKLAGRAVAQVIALTSKEVGA
jgi:hypothetical protein